MRDLFSAYYMYWYMYMYTLQECYVVYAKKLQQAYTLHIRCLWINRATREAGEQQRQHTQRSHAWSVKMHTLATCVYTVAYSYMYTCVPWHKALYMCMDSPSSRGSEKTQP